MEESVSMCWFGLVTFFGSFDLLFFVLSSQVWMTKVLLSGCRETGTISCTEDAKSTSFKAEDFSSFEVLQFSSFEALDFILLKGLDIELYL